MRRLEDLHVIKTCKTKSNYFPFKNHKNINKNTIIPFVSLVIQFIGIVFFLGKDLLTPNDEHAGGRDSRTDPTARDCPFSHFHSPRKMAGPTQTSIPFVFFEKISIVSVAPFSFWKNKLIFRSPSRKGAL